MGTKAKEEASSVSVPKCGMDVVEAEFERFAEAMDLDIDQSTMDAEDKSSFKGAFKTFAAAMQSGNLVVNEDGEPVFTPKKGDTSPITFHEPDGAAVMARDGRKKDHDVAKMYAQMAAMTGESIPRFAGMKARDLKVATAIFVLFMAE